MQGLSTQSCDPNDDCLFVFLLLVFVGGRPWLLQSGVSALLCGPQKLYCIFSPRGSWTLGMMTHPNKITRDKFIKQMPFYSFIPGG